MAKVKIPDELALQIALLSNIIAKNDSDGANSPLASWLTDKGIDLAADAQAGIDAMAHDKQQARLEAIRKINYAARDASFNPVFTFIRQGAQALKTFYAPNHAALADWNLPVTDSGRINYPPSFEDRQALAVGFFEKLASFGDGKSPLAVFIKTNQINVAALTESNLAAASQNADAEAAAKKAENETEQRDLLWATPLAHIHAIADYLKSVYPANPRQLGEWGFTVDESVAKGKERLSKFEIGESRTIENVVIGSIVTNLGKGDAIVHKGKGTGGLATVLKVNEKMGMVKGYSKITVVNPSTLETFTLSILPPEE